MKVKLKPRKGIDARKVLNGAKKANFRGLGHAGAAVRLTARRSIRRGPKPSRPGSAPHTRRGQLKRALRYAVEKQKQSVVVGPTHEIVGPSAMAHEFGGMYRKRRYARRPFMGPALMKNLDRLPKFWAGSIK